MKRRLVVALALGFGIACDDYLYQPGGGGEGTVPEGANWTAVKAFFEAECNQCHSTTLPILPDDVEADIASGAGDLVVAGSSADSSLWRVISGELGPDDFDVMPLGTGPLPASETSFIAEWIDNGASLEEGGTTGTDPTPPTGSGPVYDGDWTGVQQLMAEQCEGCHGDGGIAEPVMPGDIEDDLANNVRDYVSPYSLEESMLWRLASGNLDEGDYGVMPPSTGPLASETLAALETWILDGAKTDEPPNYQPNWSGVELLIQDNCYPCHQAGGASSVQLPEAIEEDLLNGAGQYVVPKSAPDSLLWRLLSGTGDLATDGAVFMPPTGPLGTGDISHVEQWINMGAEL